MMLNNINDVLCDDCFTFSTAPCGMRHLGSPCKSHQLHDLLQLLSSSRENLNLCFKTLTSSSLNFLLLKVYG